MTKTVAFIPVRGGSKSIPLKNIKPICGKPLVYWTAVAANDCEAIDEVYVATDSDRIRETVESFSLSKVRVIGRSPESASDTASTEFAMLEFARQYDFDTMVLVQATSPLLRADDLNQGMQIYSKPDVDSVLSVVKDKRFYWEEGPSGVKPINYDVYNRPRRQEFDGCYLENGSFYITSRERLLQSQNRVSGTIAACVMPEITSFEIDEPSDWVIIEHLLKRVIQDEEKALDFSCVKMLLTDCDGCLTDAGMYYSENGDELKKFNTRDGAGFALLRGVGIKVGIITSEDRALNQRRAQKLKLDYLIQGCTDKASAITTICEQTGIDSSEVCYVGDDMNDVPALKLAGIPCCPADAIEKVKQIACYVTNAKGGEGVIREIAEQILNDKQ